MVLPTGALPLLSLSVFQQQEVLGHGRNVNPSSVKETLAMEHTGTWTVTGKKRHRLLFSSPGIRGQGQIIPYNQTKKPALRVGSFLCHLRKDSQRPRVLPPGSSLEPSQHLRAACYFLSDSSWKRLTQPLRQASHLKLPDLERSSLSDSDTCFFSLFFCACDIWKWKESFFQTDLGFCFVFVETRSK